MHLIYKSCVASANTTHITLQTQFNDCGTFHNETENKIRFMNEVKTELLIVGGVVTRTQEVKLPFYCEYSKQKLLSVSFRPRSVVFVSEGNYGSAHKYKVLKLNISVKPKFLQTEALQDKYLRSGIPACRLPHFGATQRPLAFAVRGWVTKPHSCCVCWKLPSHALSKPLCCSSVRVSAKGASWFHVLVSIRFFSWVIGACV